MNGVTGINVFCDDKSRIRALTDDPFALRISAGETDIVLFVATTAPSSEELGAAARFLDEIILHAVELKSTVLREMAKPTHTGSFHLDFRADCPACIAEKAQAPR